MNNRRSLLQEVQVIHDIDQPLFDAESVNASAEIASGTIDVSVDKEVTLFISTTKAATVFVQLSNDETDDPDKAWYDLCNSSGTVLTFSLNNSKKAIPLSVKSIYMRVIVRNDDASNANVITAGVI